MKTNKKLAKILHLRNEANKARHEKNPIAAKEFDAQADEILKGNER